MKIQLEQTDPAEMQNLLLGKYKVQLLSFLITSIIAILATINYNRGHWEILKDSENPTAFFSFFVLFASILVLIILIFVYLQTPVLKLQKNDATGSLSGITWRMNESQIKLAGLLSQIEILQKNSVNVTNLLTQTDKLKEGVTLAEKQKKRLEQCLEDLDSCVVNSFRKYIIYLFRGSNGLKIA